MKFNEKLIELRKQKGWSQEELGDKLNVSRQTVSKWESGQTTPEMDRLILLSELFEITLDELITPDKVLEKNKIIENIRNKISEDNIDEQLKEKIEFIEKVNKKNEKNKKIVKIIFFIIILVLILIITFRFLVTYKTYDKTVSIIRNLPWTGGKVTVDISSNDSFGSTEYYLLRNNNKFVLKKMENYTRTEKETYIDLNNKNSEIGGYDNVIEIDYENNTYKIINNYYEENMLPVKNILNELVDDYKMDILGNPFRNYLPIALNLNNNIRITNNDSYSRMHYYIGNEKEGILDEYYSLMLTTSEDTVKFKKLDIDEDNITITTYVVEIGVDYSDEFFIPNLDGFDKIDS